MTVPITTPLQMNPEFKEDLERFRAETARLRTEIGDVPEAIELDDAAHHAAIDAAMRLAEALARRDLDAVMGLVRYRTDETARAFDFDADENERAVSEAFDRLVADPSFAIAPARRSALRATPCAGERVFHITRDDGRELVVSRDEPAQRMQVYVAPIEGVWRVVR